MIKIKSYRSASRHGFRESHYRRPLPEVNEFTAAVVNKMHSNICKSHHRRMRNFQKSRQASDLRTTQATARCVNDLEGRGKGEGRDEGEKQNSPRKDANNGMKFLDC